MKVLIVANYAKEHINKFHLSTIKKFKEMGWQVDVACRLDEEVPYCDHAYDLPLARNPFRLQTFFAIKRLRDIIEHEQYDVVHCHTYAGKFVGILTSNRFRKQGLKVVYSAHGLQYFKGASALSWLLFMPVDKWLVSKTDVLVTANQEDFETVRRHRFPYSALEKCCGAGVKLERFDHDDGQSRESVRRDLGISEDSTALIYVAELNRNKNQEMLIHMLKLLSERVPNVYLLLVGPDHCSGAIQKAAEVAGVSANVKCLGWRSDVPALIRAADCAVASSIREGFGVNILEYMYCKVPVVAVDNRGHREIIENGVNGFIVPQNDHVAMAEKVECILADKNLKGRFVEKALETVEKFKDEAIVEQIVEIYKKNNLC
ncbi:MAG: glycosyltransferase [Clostridia bacterium]|nr:glycosyltransferase [Clostridia bacterium]